jgi:hypothetical protein
MFNMAWFGFIKNDFKKIATEMQTLSSDCQWLLIRIEPVTRVLESAWLEQVT